MITSDPQAQFLNLNEIAFVRMCLSPEDWEFNPARAKAEAVLAVHDCGGEQDWQAVEAGEAERKTREQERHCRWSVTCFGV
jgi:hypothetical protein